MLQRAAVGRLADADAGTGVRGFDEDGVAQLCRDAVQNDGAVQRKVGAAGGRPLAVGHPGGVHQRVGDGFVHADGAAQHAAAHVGDARQLEQTLDGAVLAVFAVHDGGADVDADKLGLTVLQQPDAVIAAVGAEDAGRAVALLPAAVGHRFGRGVTGQPAAGLGDADGKNLVFVRARLLRQRTQPCRGRYTTDLVLAGDAAKEQRDA